MNKAILASSGKPSTVAVLDLGTSKIACFIATISTEGVIKITGIGHQLSKGIRAGQIVDMKEAESAVCAAVAAAEKMAGTNIEKAYVNLSGSAIESVQLDSTIDLGSQEITSRDMYRLLMQGYEEGQSDDHQVIHSFPLEYSIDKQKGVKEPRGMYGNKLGAHLHIIRAQQSAILNLVQCMARAHLDVEGFISSPYASGLACLNDDDRKLGALIIDMGAGHTSFAVFAGNEPIYADSIPVGGAHITNDLAVGLSTSIASAERIKTLYGNVINSPRDEHEMLDIEQSSEHGPGTETVHIRRSTLVEIIQPRVEETFEMVKKRLHAAGFGYASSRLIITGGASQLAGIRQFAGHVLGLRALQGIPLSIEGNAESTNTPAFSTCAGMLYHVLRQRQLEEEGLAYTQKRSLRLAVIRMSQWLKENF